MAENIAKNHTHQHEHQHSHEHNHAHHEEEEMHLWQPLLSFLMLIAGILLTAFNANWFQSAWIRFAWYAIAWLPVGLNVAKEAAEAAHEGEIFSEFMLMTIASIGAFAIGEYPEAVAVMLLYCVGEWLQDRAVSKARRNISALIEFRPDRATVIKSDGQRQDMAPEEVKTGEIIEVKAGDRVPLDGTLLSDSADFNTSALTGESLPRMISQDEEVLAGMISADKTIQIRVIRPAEESAVARILGMVEDATSRKAPAELFIRKFAKVYTPVVVCLALLVVLVPWLWSLVSSFNYVFNDWFFRSLIFLVISCPCALVISIPLSYFAGIGAASKHGILFKGSNFLDAVSQLTTVVFDKTGTLTTGEFHVDQIVGISSDELKKVAAIEKQSTHPIARAIIKYVNDEPKCTVSDFKNIAGYGLEAVIDGEKFAVGTLRLMQKQSISCPESLQDVAETMVVCAKNGQYIGHILLTDTLKDDAEAAVSSLKTHNIDSVILSGDKQKLVDRVAKQLNVDTAYGDLLPEGKVSRMQELVKSGKRTAFVGDGINDAPVLALADVGIAMGGLGSDMAVETADIVIQTDQPSRVSDAVSIGKKTRTIVKQNIVFAIGVKLLVMILGIFGIANLWEAVFADVGVALLAVLNAMRLTVVSR